MNPAGRPGGHDGPEGAADGPAAPVSLTAATAGERAPGAGRPARAPAGPEAGSGPRPRAGPAPRRRLSPVARHLLILAGYLGAGILFTWPRLAYLFDHKLPGTRDAGAYVWGFWWFARQLVHLSNPWGTHYLAAPAGAQLRFHALLPLPGLL